MCEKQMYVNSVSDFKCWEVSIIYLLLCWEQVQWTETW